MRSRQENRCNCYSFNCENNIYTLGQEQDRKKIPTLFLVAAKNTKKITLTKLKLAFCKSQGKGFEEEEIHLFNVFHPNP